MSHFTLTGHDYSSSDVFELERARMFSAGWQYLAREEYVANRGDVLVVDVAGESIILVRDHDDVLHAHHNVCRHRGSRLCEPTTRSLKRAIKCPYHAWSYGLDGALIGTPNVATGEIDRASLSLWPVAVDVWQGFVFASLDPEVQELHAWLAEQGDSPIGFEHHELGDLRVGARTVSDVAANWKVLIENYNECLHCPTVHPELVQLVPLYRSGNVVDDTRTDGGATLSAGSTSFTHTGRSLHPVLPGMDDAAVGSYFGCTVFPSMFLDITGTCAIATRLDAKAAALTQITTEYLFTPAEIATPGFDPTDIVTFSELVAKQDYDVCERVQQGVSSRAFTRGVLAHKDELLLEFHERYRRALA